MSLVYVFSDTSGSDTSDISEDGEDVQNENWNLNHTLSTENYAVYTMYNGSSKMLVIDGGWDKYRLGNGSLLDSDYEIVDFEMNKSKFSVQFGEKTPSINFSYKNDNLKFSFLGYGIYDKDDGDYLLLKNSNNITPFVSGNIITYENIINGVDISYEVNKTGANKLITFVNHTYDSLPDGYSDNTFVVFVEEIEGDYPKVNSSFRNMLFQDVMIPDADNVWKRIITRNAKDYLLTAIRFDRYNSSSFPFSIDPSLTPPDLDEFCGLTDSVEGDTLDIVEIKGGITVYAGCDNCSEGVSDENSDCTWTVNATNYIFIEEGSVLNGMDRGLKGSASNPGAGVGLGGGGGVSSGGGGGGGYGGGGTGSGVNSGDGGSSYNTTVPSDDVWAGSGGGAGNAGDGSAGGNGGAGVYLEASNITIDGRINMHGGQGTGGVNQGGGAGGGAGVIVLRARDNLILDGDGGDSYPNTVTLNIQGGFSGIQSCTSSCSGGGGGGGGWVELYYANIRSPTSLTNSSGGTCTGGPYVSCTPRTGFINGVAGNSYSSQVNVAPNFTAIPSYSGTPSISGDVVLHANVSSQIPLLLNDYVSSCNFSVWESSPTDGAGFYVNNSNGTVYGEQDWFNWTYTYTALLDTTYHWNVTCTDNESLTTVNDDRGKSVVDSGQIANIIVTDTTVPSLSIESPAEGEAFTSVSIPLNITSTDDGSIQGITYTIGGLDCGTSLHVGCLSGQNLNQTLKTGNCASGNDCSQNTTISLVGNASAGSGIDNLQIHLIMWDGGGNMNETTVNFTVNIPSAPSTPPGGGGGVTTPIMAVVPFCGDGECQPEAGENIATCTRDCATLARLKTGEIFKEGIVLEKIFFLLIFIALASLISNVVYKRMYRHVKGFIVYDIFRKKRRRY